MKTNSEKGRIPEQIAQAECGSACDRWYCSPVEYNMIVFYQKKKSPNVWRMKNERITVAYVYTK
jgi:hypothetical protein